MKTFEERFHAKYEIDPNTECWVWTGMRKKLGYGRIKVVGARRYLLAHRVSWELYYGVIPPGICVCHACDVPACVNPNHLFLGTVQDNIRDKINKGRHRGWFFPNRKSKRYKLTEENVLSIRERKMKESEYANFFGVTRATISDILKNRTWRHLP
jgi:hypothetical protein